MSKNNEKNQETKKHEEAKSEDVPKNDLSVEQKLKKQRISCSDHLQK